MYLHTLEYIYTYLPMYVTNFQQVPECLVLHNEQEKEPKCIFGSILHICTHHCRRFVIMTMSFGSKCPQKIPGRLTRVKIE